MKILTRMIAFLSFLVMIQYAHAAGNSIYIDQIGAVEIEWKTNCNLRRRENVIDRN